MIPYKVDNSDAFFNLGFAVGVAQLLPAGVYVAMNGRVFHGITCKKIVARVCLFQRALLKR